MCAAVKGILQCVSHPPTLHLLIHSFQVFCVTFSVQEASVVLCGNGGEWADGLLAL